MRRKKLDLGTEYSLGRIYTASANWVYSYTQNQYKKTVKINPFCFIESTCAKGIPTYLIAQRGVQCYNREMCDGTYPESKNDKGRFFVPASVCRKCQYNARETKSARRMFCLFLRELRKNELESQGR